ncbi:hypothetical protein GTA09_16935 [Rhodococcus hoagii]|nr:hypothetical protein [Prescottella equi]
MTNDNITATKTVTPATAYRGDDVTVKIRIDAKGTDRYLREFTDIAPVGYELRSVTSRAWRSGPLLGDWNQAGSSTTRRLKTRTVQSSCHGSVTATASAPHASWSSSTRVSI